MAWADEDTAAQFADRRLVARRPAHRAEPPAGALGAASGSVPRRVEALLDPGPGPGPGPGPSSSPGCWPCWRRRWPPSECSARPTRSSPARGKSDR